MIRRLRNSNDPFERGILEQVPQEIIEAADTRQGRLTSSR